jgi:hypothetical protein
MMTTEPPTLQQLQDQCNAELAAIDAALAADLGDLDEAAVMALPFVEFQARQVRRMQAVREKQDVINRTLAEGAAVSEGAH